MIEERPPKVRALAEMRLMASAWAALAMCASPIRSGSVPNSLVNTTRVSGPPRETCTIAEGHVLRAKAVLVVERHGSGGPGANPVIRQHWLPGSEGEGAGKADEKGNKALAKQVHSRSLGEGCGRDGSDDSPWSRLWRVGLAGSGELHV